MAHPVQARSVRTLEAILAAAEMLIARQGINSLTMEAVAAEAGISKGGVLHHFRSREALIEGLVARKLTTIRAGTAAQEHLLGEAPDRALRAMVRHSAVQYGEEPGFPPALLVAATESSDCLDAIRGLLDETLARIRADSRESDAATVLVFAALGLLLSRALGFSKLDPDDGARLFATIERMAGERHDQRG